MTLVLLLQLKHGLVSTTAKVSVGMTLPQQEPVFEVELNLKCEARYWIRGRSSFIRTS
jgi:hypothetical protein